MVRPSCEACGIGRLSAVGVPFVARSDRSAPGLHRLHARHVGVAALADRSRSRRDRCRRAARSLPMTVHTTTCGGSLTRRPRLIGTALPGRRRGSGRGAASTSLHHPASCRARGLETAAVEAARIHGAQLFQVVDRDPLIANIGDVQHVQRRDYLSVDASRLGLTPTRTSLAEWALDGSRLPSGWPAAAERLAEVQQAIAALADLPTARLERVFAEHLDLCFYRMDAWIIAIYAQRLADLQSAQQTPGLHFGAFGWVEISVPIPPTGWRSALMGYPRLCGTAPAPECLRMRRMAATSTGRRWRKPPRRPCCAAATCPMRAPHSRRRLR